MADYKGKVVTITGAASGLGKGMATRFAEKGARLSLADLDAENLARVEAELKAKGVEVLTTVLDVRDGEAVEKFAERTFAAFGGVDYCINNAGVHSMGTIWRIPAAEWRTVFEINVMGVVNGILAFVPRMIAQDRECFVVNTASNAGLQVNTGIAPYAMSKHAVVSITESLAVELQAVKSKVKAYAFCPGLVPTGLSRNSEQIKDQRDPYFQTESYKKIYAYGAMLLEKGMSMDLAMDRFFAGLEADDFYIRTHDNEEEEVSYRVRMVLERKRPAPITK
ncbi:MAG: SDR family NAD(P)-dependent oxidoreductase [Syntrophomonadaceae bacterium]|nr:SDR family NAD(P)-dependent oxidoreductase [Syntrophomonadaceae bacterium]